MKYYCYATTEYGIYGIVTSDKVRVRRFKMAFWRYDIHVYTKGE